MRFWGLSDDNEMKALLAYLRTFQQPEPQTTPQNATPGPR
jgi:hypothetical protein